MIIQSDLKWSLHIETIIKKLHKTIGVINRSKNKLNTEIMLTLYYSFFYPYLIYGNIFWGAANKHLIDKIHILQKRYIRLCFHLNRFDHTEDYFLKTQILTIDQINDYLTLNFIYRILNFAEYNVLNTFERINSNTRCFGELRIPKSRTALNDKSWRIEGAKKWNKLNLNDKTFVSYSCFKKETKKTIINE